ncbi:hypothetical protein [Psychrobacter sp. I-STPA6b]|uniref:hypothetical protein n=1 Tax=Psychrobacter sp. I-STPA6b TaxID=2585718 RepID=UPI001D0C2592|nr:hypothetical protein [Psychrobacter sp. I-STPA6b]
MVMTLSSSEKSSEYLMLTPAGVFEAFGAHIPSKAQKSLQKLFSKTTTMAVEDWVAQYSDDWLEDFSEKGWLEILASPLPAPSMPLDKFLPYVVASLSGHRKAAIASNEGFCLAHIGYTQEQADTLSVAAADFGDFLTRQQQRGWGVSGEAVSFFKQIDLLLPSTSFIFLWIDGSGYFLILEGEPLTNNRAFVELIWGIKTSGLRFNHSRKP